MKIVELASGWNLDKLPASIKGYSRKSIIKFNPSITFYKYHNEKPTYIMTYRVWLTSKNKPTKWPGEPQAQWANFWKSEWDGTGIAIVQINSKNNINVLTDKILRSGKNKIDMRVFRTSNCKFIVTYNTFGNQNIRIGEDRKDRKHAINACFKPKTKKQFSAGMLKPTYCTFLNKADLKIKKDGHYSFHNAKVLCPNQSFVHEKNWALFEKKGQLLAHYGFYPYSIINISKQCTFKKIQVYYRKNRKNDNLYKQFIYLSCGTPLIPWNDNEYLGVGHSKIDYKSLLELHKNKDYNNLIKYKAIKYLYNIKKKLKLPDDTSKWWLRRKVVHEKFFYFMFFYTIDKNTYELKNITYQFQPQNAHQFTTIVFPMGLSKYKDDYIVSYGVNDTAIDLMFISPKEIKKMFIDYNKLENVKFVQI